MSKINLVMLLLIMSVALFCDIWYVDCNPLGFGHYQTIQDAIDDEYGFVTEGDTIMVLSGTYNEQININSSAPDNLTICSSYLFTEDYEDIETTIIDGNNAGIKLFGVTGYTICGITITNCYNDSEIQAAGITVGNHIYPCPNTTIRNCIINNCVNDGKGGGAIRINRGLNCLIESCIIEDNINDEDNVNYPDQAAGIFIGSTGYINHPVVKNCIIRNNTGGGIDLITYSDINLDLLTIEKTLISDNSTLSDGAAIDLDFSSIEMDWCTLVNNSSEYPSAHAEGIAQGGYEYFDTYKNISNSIILDTSNFYDDDIIKYCGHLEDDDMVPNPANGSTGNIEITLTESFVSGDDLYHLCWDSPCIDAGNPDNDGDYESWLFDEDDQDADGSRMDIGCFPYEDQDRWEYEDEDIVWMSFPKLPCADGVNNGDQILASNVFVRFEETTMPDIEVWKEKITGLNPSFTGIYDSYEEEYDWDPQNYEFNSTDGLKIKVDDDFDPVNPLITGGLLCELNTPLTVTTGANDLNWVGYFVPYKMNVMDAIDATTLDKLTAIKTHDWSLYKKSGNWYGAYPPGGPTLCYGDMVELFTSETLDFQFCWQTLGSSGGNSERKATQYFSYKEELDYQSIFVELGEEKPEEIAVYIDGICKGAEVVDVDSLLEIRAYILEEPQGQEIEIVTASGRAVPSKVSYSVVDDGLKQERSIFTDRNKMYQIVSLETGEDLPEPEKVLNCYPNPFNPELTIVYRTTEHSEYTEINIYNIKGQKVRTLSIAALPAGEHSVIWQGKDDSGNQVSSGIYFIRMRIGKEIHTEKAVLMK